MADRQLRYGGSHKPRTALVIRRARAKPTTDEALKTLPPTQDKTQTTTQQGLQFCNQLFAIERDLKDVSPEKRHAARMEHSRPILHAYLAWLRQQRSRITPKSKLGEAIIYSLNQWGKLTAFLKDGRLEIDNNL